MIKLCKQCNKKFHTIPAKIKVGKGKFCSRECYWKSKRGKKGHSPSQETRNKIRIAQQGSKSNNWKGGKTKNHGYVLIKFPQHPFANANGYIHRSRSVCEKHLNRILDKTEIPHHINEQRDDDRPENLFVFENNSQHRLFHIFVFYWGLDKNWLRSNII